MTIAEIQVFAAAMDEDPWASMRDAIVSGLRDQKVDCTLELGRFGTEIHAVMPTVDLDGNAHVQPVRFVGVRGSRWLVRAVISGDGALALAHPNAMADAEIDEVISKLVINRGEDPVPPGERLAMRSPDMNNQNVKSADLNHNEVSQSDPVEANDNFKFGKFHIQL
jgi:hypothetical protein